MCQCSFLLYYSASGTGHWGGARGLRGPLASPRGTRVCAQRSSPRCSTPSPLEFSVSAAIPNPNPNPNPKPNANPNPNPKTLTR